MGTTLTGTTPQDTYDSLIKVTDNGPLSGSLKVLTDGLGNNSALSLSTAAASVTGTLAVSSNATLTSSGISVRLGSATANAGANILIAGASSTKNWSLGVQQNVSGALEFTPTATNGATTLGTTPAMVILDAGNVGIGTSAPTAGLTIAKSGSLFGSGSQYFQPSGNVFANLGEAVSNQDNWVGILGNYNSTSGSAGLLLQANFRDVGSQAGHFISSRATALGIADLVIGKLQTITDANTPPTLVEQARFLAAGGLTFNGDTAAANALDDYEEGTFTPTIAFGGASVGVTYLRNGGTYTKIGRQVTICADLILSAKGSSTGSATITGLPFTINGTTSFLCVPSFRYAEVSFTEQYTGYGSVGTTTIAMEQAVSGAGTSPITHTDLEDASQIMVTLTYFV